MTDSDHFFSVVDLPSLRLPYADGVIVSRRVARPAVDGGHVGHAASPGHGGRGHRRDHGEHGDHDRDDRDDRDDHVGYARRTGPGGHEVTWVDFVPVTTAEAVRVSTRLASRPDLDAVVVHERYVPVNRTALAVAFATKLNWSRAARGECPDVVTTAVRPDLSAVPGQVSIPHLVTVAEPAEPGLVDRVVWEVMPPEVFLCWLPGMAGARRTGEIERRLPRLLRMRAMIRDGGLGRLPFADELSAVLGGGPLTIRAVFTEPDLFLAAADYLYDVADGDGVGESNV